MDAIVLWLQFLWAKFNFMGTKRGANPQPICQWQQRWRIVPSMECWWSAVNGIVEGGPWKRKRLFYLIHSAPNDFRMRVGSRIANQLDRNASNSSTLKKCFSAYSDSILEARLDMRGHEMDNCCFYRANGCLEVNFGRNYSFFLPFSQKLYRTKCPIFLRIFSSTLGPMCFGLG